MGRADTVRLQEDHDVADGLLLPPAFADARDQLGADALDFLEERGAFVDDGKSAFAEDLDDAPCGRRSDALDEPGAEISLDAFDRAGRQHAQAVSLELLAKFW